MAYFFVCLGKRYLSRASLTNTHNLFEQIFESVIAVMLQICANEQVIEFCKEVKIAQKAALSIFSV